MYVCVRICMYIRVIISPTLQDVHGQLLGKQNVYVLYVCICMHRVCMYAYIQTYIHICRYAHACIHTYHMMESLSERLALLY